MSPEPLTVGLVWPVAERLTNITVRYERYVRGFERLGHRVVTVCPAAAAEGYGPAVHAVADEAALRDPGLWRTLRLDVAVVVTWLKLPELVAAIKAACPHVVSIADSDGLVGVRARPLAMLRRMLSFHTDWRRKLGAVKFWAQLTLGGYQRSERPILDSAAAADRITLTSPAARANLADVFASHGRPELAEKLAVVPYPVDDDFLTGEVPAAADRPERVVAIGRWDDPQKDAALLCRVAARHLAAGGRTVFHLFGPNGARCFAPLAKAWPQVRYHGPQPPAVIAEHLRGSRALFLPSRWESGPIVLNEALASGCTVVGTDSVPAVVSACAEGGFGAVSRGRSAAGLADALRAELAAWDRGDRDPARIAAHWRPRFDPAAVCRLLLAGPPAGARP
jgi:glycosyltransferase involved in cell wall biosynthesis